MSDVAPIYDGKVPGSVVTTYNTEDEQWEATAIDYPGLGNGVGDTAEAALTDLFLVYRGLKIALVSEGKSDEEWQQQQVTASAGS